MSVLDEHEYNSVNNSVNSMSIFLTSRRSTEHIYASMKVTESRDNDKNDSDKNR